MPLSIGKSETNARAREQRPGSHGEGAQRESLKSAVRLQTSGRFQDAAKIYATLLKEDPRNAQAWGLMGTVQIERGEMSRALASISRALALSPENAVFHNNMAYVLGALGKFNEAEAHYRRAVSLDPKYAEAYFNLSGSTRFKREDPVISKIEALLRKPGLSSKGRCFLHFAAGKVYDDIGSYDLAFAHYQAGNAVKDVRPNSAYGGHYLRSIMKTFGRELIARLSGGGSFSEVPVFVVGMPRSGTSLVEQILASHPVVQGAGELPDIAAISKQVGKHDEENRAYPTCMDGIGRKHMRGFAEAYLRRVGSLVPGAGRIVDKAPLNFRHLGLIHLMFPKARIIHCCRDPLDTCLSCYFQNFSSGQEYAFDLVEVARFYQDYRKMMEHWAEVLPTQLHHVRYEDLVSDPASAAQALIKFCGLDWHPACAAPEKARRVVRTASRWQVRQSVYRSSVGRWRHYDRHIRPLRDTLESFTQQEIA